uniref:Uncharacterized protein n=1 Tax=Anopheles melas TaxID=34690 RepID=A0A182TSE6_9DIPT
MAYQPWCTTNEPCIDTLSRKLAPIGFGAALGVLCLPKTSCTRACTQRRYATTKCSSSVALPVDDDSRKSTAHSMLSGDAVKNCCRNASKQCQMMPIVWSRCCSAVWGRSACGSGVHSVVEANDSRLDVRSLGVTSCKNKPFVNSAIHELEKKLSSATAKLSCQQQSEINYQQPPHHHHHHHPQFTASSYPPVHQPYQGHHHYAPPPPHQPFYEEEPTHRVEESKFHLNLPQQQAPTSSNESSGLHAILQVIRAEQQQQQQQQQQQEKQHQSRKEPSVSKHCDLYIATASTASSPPQGRAYQAANHHTTLPPVSSANGTSSVQPPKFSAVNFRRVQRHPPVSFPKRPLVTQRSLGSPPSVNVGSSYSPSGAAGSSIAFAAAASSIANGQQQHQPRRRQQGSRRHEAFVKTRSKTISDFFGPESTPVSRLLNIICQEKEAERVAAHIMNQQQQQQQSNSSSRPAVAAKPSASAPSSHGTARAHPVRPTHSSSGPSVAVRSRKENIVPSVAVHSGSDTGGSSSSSAGVAPVLVDPASSSRTPNTLPSSAILSKQQQSPLPPSSKPTTTTKRPHSAGFTASSTKAAGNNGTTTTTTRPVPTRPVATGARERSASSGHNRSGDEKQSSSATAGAGVTKQIRTTRSSRLRAAAAHGKQSFFGGEEELHSLEYKGQ